MHVASNSTQVTCTFLLPTPLHPTPPLHASYMNVITPHPTPPLPPLGEPPPPRVIIYCIQVYMLCYNIYIYIRYIYIHIIYLILMCIYILYYLYTLQKRSLYVIIYVYLYPHISRFYGDVRQRPMIYILN